MLLRLRHSCLSVVAATVILAVSSVAQAASFSVTSVSGIWSNVQSNTPRTTRITGDGTSSIAWGGTRRRDRTQSGYSFDGKATSNLASGVDFDLGTFTHNNRPIPPSASIRSATLTVAINVLIGSTTRTVETVLDFTHFETPNRPPRRGLCANAERNGVGVNSAGCADRVTVAKNIASTNTYVIDGITYVLEITGLQFEGKTFSEFWTREQAANAATLRARFTVTEPPPPPPSPVPLPATLPMLLAGLGALALYRRRA